MLKLVRGEGWSDMLELAERLDRRKKFPSPGSLIYSKVRLTVFRKTGFEGILERTKYTIDTTYIQRSWKGIRLGLLSHNSSPRIIGRKVSDKAFTLTYFTKSYTTIRKSTCCPGGIKEQRLVLLTYCHSSKYVKNLYF